MARKTSGRRADMRWTFGTHVADSVAAGTGSQAVIVTSGTISQTLFRIRGWLNVSLDAAAGAAGDILSVGYGLLVQQGGATATSLPLTDGDAPFFWYQAFHLVRVEAVAGGAADVSSIVSIPIDGKAMRVIRPDQEIVSIFETSDVAGAPAWTGTVSSRFLLGD